MLSSSRKKASAAPDPKANSASPAKGAGAGPLASAARGDEAAILQAIQSLREDLLKKIDDNTEMQSKELRREISQLRDELRSAIDRVSSRTKA
ncbi:Ankyrin repeat domain containing protein 6 [Dissostichus eleginoides]|uniref:Ankyrin repeat domain containing protein 6 n=1 Tax=Dissostichus eleginoides TaxID=100907 RepID=A0AAD9C146_DISEL|nr:Ankyrin repeat domain containing protein 6 [Dissostichus eleginoides]